MSYEFGPLHDGEESLNCTGISCDCEERNFRDSSLGKRFCIAILIGLVIGAFNGLLGALVMIGALWAMILFC